ncbi:MAG: M23 family metallopeptidase [Armatimonadetes bacterium]|nr:M23 family metallopeptidase [Armatimonadota bacterium]
MLGLRWWAAVVMVSAVAASAAGEEPIKLVPMLPASDGRLVCPVGLVLRGPAEGSAAFQSGSVLAWNEAGRVFYQQDLDTAAFTRLTGVSRLSSGQAVLVTQRHTFRVSDRPVRLAYVLDMLLPDGTHDRQVHWYALRLEAQPLPTLPAGRPRFEIRPYPDQPEGSLMTRSGRSVWAFQVWLQETNGVPVKVSSVQWQARDGAGQVVAEAKLPAATTGGAALVCGPDAVTAIAGQRIVVPTGQNAAELALVATGNLPNGEAVTAMYRAPLAPARTTPSSSVVRLPFRGIWHVAAAPGQAVNFGNLQNGWVFDMLDKAKRPYRGTGARPADHLAFGQNVLAPADGTVSAVSAETDDAVTPRAGGLFAPVRENYVLIDHGHGERSYLGGLSRAGLQVVVGMTIRAGGLVGRVGNNGAFARPALTYRLLRGADAVPELLSIAPRLQPYRALVGGKWQAVDGPPEDDELVQGE